MWLISSQKRIWDMGKDYGADRTIKPGSAEYMARETEVKAMEKSGLYSTVEMSKTGGGYMAIEEGTRHKPEEIEAAKHMADAGYKVVLKNETGVVVTPDGYLYSYSYEQRTPVKGGRSFMKALEHAKKKGADVAVIYDKNQVYHAVDVEKGIRSYESYASNRHRFKRIIVISKSGKVYEHFHNDIGNVKWP